ncbi:HpcH/HpaI aldolase family protein [Primorskyibacter sp. S187A]|uniref:HpcH/HpaI aldolase family protein n=1 Tax=Primorskyibacter sp. S187A TaxID=3415130 RepID=UPI003C7A3C17
MKLKSNRFLKAIRAGEPQIGLWVSMASPFCAEVVAGADFDWVIIDMEHAHTDVATASTQMQAFAPYHTTAMVRPAWNDAVMIKRVLDAGAPGLLIPMVQNAAEAEAAVRACRYPPRGIRGVSGIQRGNNFGRVSDYFERVEEETAILLQIETQAALDCAEEIAAVDGCDGIFFGPADIAADLGRLPDAMHKDVWDAILPVAKRLIAKGVPVGTLVLDPVFAKQLVEDGFTFVACGTDVALLRAGSDALRDAMR